jgi:hypothetical protein
VTQYHYMKHIKHFWETETNVKARGAVYDGLKRLVKGKAPSPKQLLSMQNGAVLPKNWQSNTMSKSTIYEINRWLKNTPKQGTNSTPTQVQLNINSIPTQVQVKPNSISTQYQLNTNSSSLCPNSNSEVDFSADISGSPQTNDAPTQPLVRKIERNSKNRSEETSDVIDTSPSIEGSGSCLPPTAEDIEHQLLSALQEAEPQITDAVMEKFLVRYLAECLSPKPQEERLEFFTKLRLLVYDKIREMGVSPSGVEPLRDDTTQRASGEEITGNRINLIWGKFFKDQKKDGWYATAYGGNRFNAVDLEVLLHGRIFNRYQEHEDKKPEIQALLPAWGFDCKNGTYLAISEADTTRLYMRNSDGWFYTSLRNVKANNGNLTTASDKPYWRSLAIAHHLKDSTT